MKELGGYFRRFKGGALAPWINGDGPPLDLEARATQAFLEVRHLSRLFLDLTQIFFCRTGRQATINRRHG
jgi:hypothetical protein